MPRTTSRRPQRRIREATLAASVFGAAPSLLYGVRREGVRDTWRYGVQATRAVATLVPRGRPHLFVGAATHFSISVAFGEAVGRLLPTRRSTLWGAAAGAAMGLIGAGIVGRRSSTFRELPFGRQLADNVAFGIIFALVADRPAVRPATPARQPETGATALADQCLEVIRS